ncbi:hypothetical protein [Isoptericola variabilis]|uniref:Heavy metal transporter n=1 Tax=Isoptericola variabilis (strain 225) TaxID=743718 RepID=F6FPT8_ISOV2|nr:hypothetical protein [Isoptericola variabilis]AEG43727.1 hypothetical protein Isova_0943 [Isoptericola variabilis 225]TWH27407.1 hypothetical protein L600_000500000800 [Isoptericola variabilis J7]
MGSRRRSRAGGVGAVAAVLVVGLAATAGVVWVLSGRDAGPVTPRCAATLEGTDWYFSPVQAENAALVAGVAVQRGLPARAATIGLATALQESRLVNIDYGDRDSLGLFQQRPSQGWGTPEQIMDPVYSTGAFYDGLVRVEGYEDMEITVAAQAVQRSAFPEAYAQHETRARAWASALTGHSPAAVSCELPPVDDDGPAGAEAQAAVAARVGRDLGLGEGSVRPGEDGTVVVDATPVAAEPGRAGWVVAHWAVATASVTGVVRVRVADRVWTRVDAAWAAAEDEPLPEGRIVLTVAAAD